jgi:WD40 repeat protein/transcriptional regulator with XRE-family HTH domain
LEVLSVTYVGRLNIAKLAKKVYHIHHNTGSTRRQQGDNKRTTKRIYDEKNAPDSISATIPVEKFFAYSVSQKEALFMVNKRLPFHEQLRYERVRRGWSQADLAEKLQCDIKSVGRWERGESWPQVYLRQKLASLFNISLEELSISEAYTHEQTAESTNQQDLRSPFSSQITSQRKTVPTFGMLLKDYRQRAGLTQESLATKVHVDRHSIRLLEQDKRHPSDSLIEMLVQTLHLSEQEAHRFALSTPDLSVSSLSHMDWGEAPHTAHLYGRDEECARLEAWMAETDCHVGLILGMGGAGKTVIARSVADRVQQQYDLVFWRSLQNAPPFEQLVRQCLEFLFQQTHLDFPTEVDEQISLLIEAFRQQRCLVILDNFETLFQAEQRAGLYREGYASYGRLLRRVGETDHRSFLLLTSREKPKEIAQAEGLHSPIRSLVLPGLAWEAGRRILEEKGLTGSDPDWQTLTARYAGNPLALLLVAQALQEVFAGEIARFLAQKTIVFGSISELLDEHFQRLSPPEQELLYWLAIEREPASLEDLRADLAVPAQDGKQLVEALSSLRRRSLLEQRSMGRIVLQPVILEYVTSRLIEHADREFDRAELPTWHQYSWLKTQTREFVRESQERLLLAPLAQRLVQRLGMEGLENKARDFLEKQRQKHLPPLSYLAGNLLNVLLHLHCDLRGFDFSHLVIRQAYLQGALLSDVNFAHARFVSSLFTSTFGTVLSVACSPQGEVFATGTTSGEIRLYDATSSTLRALWQGHTDGVWQLAFSPDGTVLASSSDDQTICLWDSLTGIRLATLTGHHNRVRALAFSPDSTTLVSGSDDQSIRLWNWQTGACVQELIGHTDRVWSVAFHPYGRILASGSTDQTVRVWDLSTSSCIQTLRGHRDAIRSVLFHPREPLLVSASDDQTVRVWELNSGQCLRTLSRHRNRVWSLAFDAEGEILATASEDHEIQLWKGVSGERRHTLVGHTQGVRSIAFLPGQPVLVSGGEDQTIRLWDIESGNSLQTLQGYTMRVLALAFSQDGRILATGSDDSALRIWESKTGQCRKVLQDQRHGLLAIAFASDNRRLASGGGDQSVLLWDCVSGRCLSRLIGHTNWVRTVAFSPDDTLLASAGEDLTIRLWDPHTSTCLHVLQGHTSWVRAVTFRPDSHLVASGSDDATIRLWDSDSGMCLRILRGHTNRVRSIAFSPNGKWLASGSEDQSIRLWDVASGQCLTTLQKSTDWIRSVAFSPDGKTLASGSEGGLISLWNLDSKLCQRSFQGHSTRVRQVSFSPDGLTLASCDDNGLTKLWEHHSAVCLQTLINERPYEHMNITGVQGLTAAQKESLKTLGALEDEAGPY